MALTKRDLAMIAAMIASAGAPAGKPRAGKASSKRKKGEQTYFTRAEIAAGKGFPCTAEDACTRLLRTAAGASSHDPEDGSWHKAAEDATE